MTLQAETKTVYAAARGDQILSDGYPTPDLAKQQAQHLAEQMQALGLEPDVAVVEVVVKTTIGRAKPYREKVDETPAPEQPADAAPDTGKATDTKTDDTGTSTTEQ